MAYRIQFRRDTSANWSSNNPILLQGEFGYESDTGFAKIGDGSTIWSSLSYFGGTGPTGPGVSSSVPGSSGATGSFGDLAADSNWLYVCIGTNTWKRTSLTGF